MDDLVRYYRKVIRISADDSPNVRYAKAQIRAGIIPTDEVIIPGVITYSEYCKREATWDEIRKCIGLKGLFYKGSELLLFPPHWLDHSRQLAEILEDSPRIRRAETIGIDTAEGGDSTTMAAIDKKGLLELVSKKTPDTSIIPGEALAFARNHQVPPERICFDAGGGGKVHADYLRARGYNVNTVAFGAKPVIEPRFTKIWANEQLDILEQKRAYLNLRAQMLWEFSDACNPKNEGGGFALPFHLEGVYLDLQRQLAPLPKLYDDEGRARMLSKNKKSVNSKSKEPTLKELLGCSPDELDSVLIAHHIMLHPPFEYEVGAIK